MNDETGNREYKRQLDRDDRFERAVVAFLNSGEGGTIYIGIEDNGSVRGVADPDLVQRQSADRIRNNIRPVALGLFDIGLEEREGKSVVRIVVSSGPDRPYYRKKDGMTPQGCFVRVGSQTQQIPEAEIEAMFARRARTSLRTIPAPNQNLRFEQLRIRYAEHGKPLNERFRESLELLTPDGKYNVVAYLLADENNVSVKVAKYAGTDKIDLVENEEYGFCSILRACDRVLEKLTVENTTSARIGRIYRRPRSRRQRVRSQRLDEPRHAGLRALLRPSRNHVPRKPPAGHDSPRPDLGVFARPQPRTHANLPRCRSRRTTRLRNAQDVGRLFSRHLPVHRNVLSRSLPFCRRTVRLCHDAKWWTKKQRWTKNKEWTKNQRWTKNKEWTKNAEFPLFNHGVAHPDF